MNRPWPAPSALLLAALLAPGAAWGQDPPPVPGADRSGLYLGHAWVAHERRLPILGLLEARTDTWVLARITDLGDRLLVEQQPCDMAVAPVAGVRVGMSEDAVPRLPIARFELQVQGEALVAPTWTTGWGEEDLDQDGLPGVTIRVQAALCGGHLQVASTTWSQARATWTAQGLEGELDVQLAQRILDASGACLRMAAHDSTDRMHGRIRYAPAPADATCTDLARAAWPVADDRPR